MKKKVILLGKGDLAIRIATWFRRSYRYNLAEIVPDLPEPEWTGSLSQWGKDNNIPVVGSGSYRDIKSRGIDLCMSVFYGKILKEDFINSCTNVINLHSSPLPKYKGVRPINWALKNNESTHGITIHKITPGIDDGPIYGQVIYPIYPDIEEVEDVYQKSLGYGWCLFCDVIDKLDDIKPYTQPHLDEYYSMKDVDKLGDRIGWRRE